jgi:DNA helicase-2/ATP-dependent DNA helicase PcrA
MADFVLNKKQEEAVLYQEGPLLIIAGAGTGKTRVITEKIRRLIKDFGVSPREILAVTFTDKAANEMLDRIGDVMPLGYQEPSVCTFHKFAENVLRDKGLEIGLDPRIEILRPVDSYRLFKKHLFDFNLKYFRPLGNPNKFITSILKFFSRLQDEAITSTDFSNFLNVCGVDKVRWGELSDAYEKYTQIKLDKSLMDFGDLINWTLTLFKNRPEILKEYQNKYPFIFVDEFQDTNWAQYELIKTIADPKNSPRLTVVGDDNQSIYKFRGAAISNILNFKNDYKSTFMVVLDENYRSFQQILDVSYSLIKNNDPDTLEFQLKIKKDLKAIRGKSPTNCVTARVFENEITEADFVALKIEELLNSNKEYTYRDFAVLARANAHLDPVVNALQKRGIPYQVVGSRGLFDLPEIRLLLSFLRFIVDPLDSVAFYDMLAHSAFNLPSDRLSVLLRKEKTTRLSLWEIFKDDPLCAETAKHLLEFLEISPKTPVSQILYRFMTVFHIVEKMIGNETIEGQLAIDNANKFFQFVFDFESKEKSNLAPNFVEYLDLAMEAGENPAQAQIEDVDTVNLMTVHSAKGLEFGAVFLISLTSDRFPTRNRGDTIEIPKEIIKETLPVGDYHLEEERRLFYVATTRARDWLFLSYALSYGGTKEKRPSGFLSELKVPVAENRNTPNRAGQLNFLGFDGGENGKIPISRKKTKVKYVSFSQIDMFKTCPLQYQFRYIFGIPTPPNHAFTFGQSMHNTLRDFERHALLNESNLSLEKLFSFYEANFDPSGYENTKHREKRYKEGKEYLENYFENGRKRLGNPILIEHKFKILIGDTPFVGVIDRVDKTDNELVITDYKTGEVREQERVDKDLQLTSYAIAANEALNIHVSKLRLYFFERAEIIETTRSEKDLACAKEDILENIEKIKTGEFPPKTSPLCKYCSYNTICPAYKNYLNL